jgi:hypothetical protein
MNKKQLTVLMQVALLVMIIMPIAAEPETGSQTIFRAEHGDTFLNLFSDDWQKAYKQNQMPVVRNRNIVRSPDILIEGTILHVSADVRLTPRAVSRVQALVKRRADLRRKLAVLAGSPGPRMQRAEDLHRMIDDDLRYVTDIDFIERELANLESSMDLPAVPPATHTWAWPIAGGCIGAMMLVVLWVVIGRRRAEGPDGDARVKATLNDLDQALGMTPLGR